MVHSHVPKYLGLSNGLSMFAPRDSQVAQSTFREASVSDFLIERYGLRSFAAWRNLMELGSVLDLPLLPRPTRRQSSQSLKVGDCRAKVEMLRSQPELLDD